MTIGYKYPKFYAADLILWCQPDKYASPKILDQFPTKTLNPYANHCMEFKSPMQWR